MVIYLSDVLAKLQMMLFEIENSLVLIMGALDDGDKGHRARSKDGFVDDVDGSYRLMP
jgi:hypothetical protein